MATYEILHYLHIAGTSMRIIAKLLKPLFLLNCWRGCYVKVTLLLDGACKHVSTTFLSPVNTTLAQGEIE